MEYEEDDDAEDVRAGAFYTTPNGNNTSFSFLEKMTNCIIQITNIKK